MLGPGRYLLGVIEILLLGGFAWLGGAAARAWLLPRFEGAPAHMASAVIALALLIWAAELLGTFGWLDPVPYLVLMAVVGLALRKFLPRPSEGEGGGGPPPPPPRAVAASGRPMAARTAPIVDRLTLGQVEGAFGQLELCLVAERRGEPACEGVDRPARALGRHGGGD
jgi:hypothetical protein